MMGKITIEKDDGTKIHFLDFTAAEVEGAYMALMNIRWNKRNETPNILEISKEA